MTRKSERGFASLIVLLISLAVLIAILALVSINMVQLTQATNESNAQQGVTALMSAEAQYLTAYPSSGYATGSNLDYLSNCPAAVNGKVTPVATAACLPVSPAYTNGNAAFGYAFAVASVADANGTTGYLITATPTNKGLGRWTYCANNQDGVLRGELHAAAPTTQAACEAFNIISAGTPSTPANAATTAWSTGTITGTSGSNCTVANNPCYVGPSLTTLPAGNYSLVGRLYIQGGDTGVSGFCTLKINSTVIDTSTGMAYLGSTFTLVGVAAVPSSANVTMTCPTGDNGVAWSGQITATSVASLN
jgi:type II secretory pathway pseudopilin PulG